MSHVQATWYLPTHLWLHEKLVLQPKRKNTRRLRSIPTFLPHISLSQSLWSRRMCLAQKNETAFKNESTEVQSLGVIRIQLIYSINVLSKYSSLISHQPSIFEGRHIDHRSSKIDISITDLRSSTRRSSIFEGQHIDLRRSTHRSSKVDTS